MNDASDRELNIDDVLAFNAQLQSLSEANLPIDLGFRVSKQTLSQKLSQISSQIALQNARGKTIEQAVVEYPSIPIQYRISLIAWSQGKTMTDAISPLNAIGHWRRDVVATLNRSLLEPLILLVLVYCGLMYLVITLVPHLEEIYSQIRTTPGVSLKILMQVRDWLPYWGPGLPVLVIAACLFWRSRLPSSNMRWLPVEFKDSSWVEKANHADNMARLEENLANERPLSENHSVSRLGQELTAKNPSPLLKWASSCTDDPNAKAGALRFVGHTFREAAKWRVVRWSSVLPNALAVFLGGLLVLGYALSLFAPMIELLCTLARP